MMTIWLYFAAFLAFAVGAAHSWLGERYILMRLFRRDNLPHLFGGPEFTVRTLRFAWHLTSVAWWGFGAILVLLARRAVTGLADFPGHSRRGILCRCGVTGRYGYSLADAASDPHAGRILGEL